VPDIPAPLAGISLPNASVRFKLGRAKLAAVCEN